MLSLGNKAFLDIASATILINKVSSCPSTIGTLLVVLVTNS